MRPMSDATRQLVARALLQLAVVVAGVLLALELHHRFALSGDRAAQDASLGALLVEIRRDANAFRDAQDVAEATAEAGSLVRAALNQQRFDGDPIDFIRATATVAGSARSPSGIGLGAASKSQDGLGKLRDDSLRTALVQYFLELRSAEQVNIETTHSQRQLRRMLPRLLALDYRQALIAESAGDVPWVTETVAVSADSVNEMVEKLLQDDQAQFLIDDIVLQQSIRFALYGQHYERALDAISRIEAALE